MQYDLADRTLMALSTVILVWFAATLYKMLMLLYISLGLL